VALSATLGIRNSESALYAFFLWALTDFRHMSKGKEKLLLGSLGADFFLGAIMNLIPASAVHLFAMPNSP
jgi:hypothetical protein